MSTPERPDDSGTFDDETLIQILSQSFQDISDPILRRDAMWLAATCNRYREALKEILARPMNIKRAMVEDDAWAMHDIAVVALSEIGR